MSDSNILKKVNEVKQKIDQYFMQLAAGSAGEWPQDDIDDLPDVEEFSKQITAVIADCVSEENNSAEQTTYETMRVVDSTIKTYNLIKYTQVGRMQMLSTVRNNEIEKIPQKKDDKDK